MLARVLRGLLLACLAGTTIYFAMAAGRLAGFMVGLTWLVTLGIVLIWLPRWAHGTFTRGDFAKSDRRYRVLRFLVVDRNARSAVDVSRAACKLAMGEYDASVSLLDQVDPDEVSESIRAAWLNNRAYSLARGRGEYEAALVHSEDAIALRPDVVGFRHTRGVALLGLGRTDEAIRQLDDLWQELAAAPPPLLEAERCFDLAQAWRTKGEMDYATDYLERAKRAAPMSVWADRASDQLANTRVSRPGDAVLADLL